MAEPSSESPAAKNALPRHLWVTNNSDHAHTLSLRPRMQEGSKTLSAPEMIHLPPGATVVDAEKWEQWKDESAKSKDGNEAQRLLTEPIPSDVHRARRSERAGLPMLVEGPEVRDKKFPLANLSPEKARALVPEIRDELMLKQLLQTERRAPVLEAVRAELERFARGARQPSA